jgi:1-aminocyclopropane-1-carboxylate deaminase/D-cysteine desulfhydrase-like pyridoxal-dependent ACC family enzyme
MSEEEIRLVKEIAETENKLSKLKEEREKISVSEDHTDEDFAVTTENNMVSEECQTTEGLPINVVYNAGQTKGPIKKKG